MINTNVLLLIGEVLVNSIFPPGRSLSLMKCFVYNLVKLFGDVVLVHSVGHDVGS